jgi:ubiquinone/menaquinone biosynthesis C-methylase UbiE
VTDERWYLPAASLDFLLPVYDPIMKLLRFQEALAPLLAQAELQPHHRVLDIGCGTGTLAVMIKRTQPSVDVTGVDPDPRALARAARKAERARVSIRLDRGFADALTYPDATFDRVFSSMMFHHVPRADKPGVLTEAHRVLKPGGRLEFLDFAGGTHSLLAHVLHGRSASGSADERLLRLMRDSGLPDARRVAMRQTIAGTIAYYQAVRT